MGILELNGATVTINAMGCRKAIADTIITGRGQSLMAVTGDQQKRHTEIKELFCNRFDMDNGTSKLNTLMYP